MAKYKCVTGFKDIYNTEHKIEGYVLDIINEVSETYNFKYIDLPEFEQTMLYSDYYGEDIKESLFTIGSRATSSISLKYNNILSIVRSIIENKLYVDRSLPTKFMTYDRVYKFNKRHKKANVVYSEYNYVVAGVSNYYADIEMVIMALDIFVSLGMEELKLIIHKNELKTAEFNDIKKTLDKLSVEYEVSKEKATHYDKLSYEIVYNDTIIANGGRHDSLFTKLEAPDVPSISLTLDIDEIKNIIEYTSLIPKMEEELDFLIVSLDKEYDACMDVACQLREYGVKVDISYNEYEERRVRDFIDRMNIPYTIFINKKDIKKGIVTVRNSLSKNEGEVYFEEFIEELIETSKHHHDN